MTQVNNDRMDEKYVVRLTRGARHGVYNILTNELACAFATKEQAQKYADKLNGKGN